MAKGSGISGRSRSAGTGQCINRSEPQCWCMIGKPGGRVLTERGSTTSLGSPLTRSDSALTDGYAQLVPTAAPNNPPLATPLVIVDSPKGNRRRQRSGTEVWKYSPPG